MTNGSSDPFGASGVGEGVTVVVCSSCRREGDPTSQPRPGASLATGTAQAAQGTAVKVTHVACLGNCNRGLSAAILKTGSWSYVFGGLDEESGADLIAGAQLFVDSEDGFLPFRGRPQALKRGMVARVPSFHNLKDLP